ncbi:endo alpha-1,4 polygalactosaminidase [Streptantibioticus cattleyicolor]|uniref:TM1410 hypothetical-related protein n=1 Tax=Streptantibioticus cattleyicolor (strain ATCC 35852 / DSM 46488 / JCM 4925 / NBRC 14057 / NRRL 8057) TaxID=1003195 RepID=F8JLT4_STREN|nr:endo alpha-1,4 polygalactosaminidase [Streptantibioticus cattleyicolor]AEW99482.1 TM1410 hypothetical-related protein [Streptantibioticus cattleyicolor NRRL 8057 = DSM 46488]CCB71477.1 conserved exported protein of unknown function [Streptantibioticus cattleyicolor NRRL 8057 = DSM 46488]
MSVSRRTGRLLTAGATAALLAISLAPHASAATPAMPKPVACAGCWHPDVKTSWDWVLRSVPTTFRKVDMYDVDGFNTPADTVAKLHAQGTKAVCYISAGSYEDWRPDAKQFPAAVLGNSNGWKGEKWLDVREIQKSDSALRKIMDARLDMCRQKGFDAVELDNIDGYANNTSFKITKDDQLYFNSTLANDTHQRGMSVLQKNDNEQIPKLLPYFDAALNEECNQFSECTTDDNGAYGLDQYVNAGKPVFNAEYQGDHVDNDPSKPLMTPSLFCPKDNANDFNGVFFAKDLDNSVYQACR